eukprot:494735-Rhodomonas_salina.1
MVYGQSPWQVCCECGHHFALCRNFHSSVFPHAGDVESHFERTVTHSRPELADVTRDASAPHLHSANANGFVMIVSDRNLIRAVVPAVHNLHVDLCAVVRCVFVSSCIHANYLRLQTHVTTVGERVRENERDSLSNTDISEHRCDWLPATESYSPVVGRQLNLHARSSIHAVIRNSHGLIDPYPHIIGNLPKHSVRSAEFINQKKERAPPRVGLILYSSSARSVDNKDGQDQRGSESRRRHDGPSLCVELTFPGMGHS